MEEQVEVLIRRVFAQLYSCLELKSISHSQKYLTSGLMQFLLYVAIIENDTEISISASCVTPCYGQSNCCYITIGVNSYGCPYVSKCIQGVDH